jgi:large subunit ribosomal protein L35
MPKMKTNRAAAKRFRATKRGGFKRNKAYNRHLKSSKSPKRRRNLRQSSRLDATEVKRIRRLLPFA